MAILGIDLGTTNSLIAVLEESKPRLIKNALSQFLTPSAISVAEDGTILTGAAAKERLITHPDRSVASFKRFMGTGQVTRLGSLSFRPEELSALILRSLKADAEADLGATVNDAVISVPAYFNDHQRKATLDAGRLAGLKVERLVNEPTAAALAYGFGEVSEGRFLVFDLGGGTFDVSILEKYEGVMEIHATTGDTQLGGDDFTSIIEEIMIRAGNVDRKSLDSNARAQLRREAENIKLGLTSGHEAQYSIPIGAKVLSGAIGRSAFEQESAPLLRRLRTPVERAILDAGLEPHQFDAIVLVGGATRMPMVRSLVARLFGRLPLIHVDPDTTVALGAAIQAGLHKRDAALKDVVMTDVCPYTLGVATVEDARRETRSLHVTPIIERNAVVPISRSKRLVTIEDNQKAISIDVYQGENLRPENNIYLGSLSIEVPPAPAGSEAVDVRFTYDINGALQVEVRVLSTGRTSAKIFSNSLGLTEDELRARFASLEAIKVPPREQIPNKALLARAERLYAEHLGESREVLHHLIKKFEAEIADQQLRDQEALRTDLAKMLDSFERFPFGSQ
jgi:molecular chaperone HscC